MSFLKSPKGIASFCVGAASLYFGKIYFNGGICDISKDLTDQVVVITGSNAGIGKETALALAKMNATIVMACRDQKRATETL